MNNGPMSCGVQQTKSSEMSKAFAEMEHAVARLEEIVKGMGVKFGPVIVDRPQCDPLLADRPPSQPCSVVVSMVRSFAEKVEAAGCDLAAMMDRCDL